MINLNCCITNKPSYSAESPPCDTASALDTAGLGVVIASPSVDGSSTSSTKTTLSGSSEISGSAGVFGKRVGSLEKFRMTLLALAPTLIIVSLPKFLYDKSLTGLTTKNTGQGSPRPVDVKDIT
jgi:hypothetical protein